MEIVVTCQIRKPNKVNYIYLVYLNVRHQHLVPRGIEQTFVFPCENIKRTAILGVASPIRDMPLRATSFERKMLVSKRVVIQKAKWMRMRQLKGLFRLRQSTGRRVISGTNSVKIIAQVVRKLTHYKTNFERDDYTSKVNFNASAECTPEKNFNKLYENSSLNLYKPSVSLQSK